MLISFKKALNAGGSDFLLSEDEEEAHEADLQLQMLSFGDIPSRLRGVVIQK